MGCVHGKQGVAWQPEHPGETHRRRLPGEKGGGRQKQHGGGGRKEDLGSRTDANDSAGAVTNNNSRKPVLNFESLPPPRLEIQPCTPRAEVKFENQSYSMFSVASIQILQSPSGNVSLVLLQNSNLFKTLCTI